MQLQLRAVGVEEINAPAKAPLDGAAHDRDAGLTQRVDGRVEVRLVDVERDVVLVFYDYVTV